MKWLEKVTNASPVTVNSVAVMSGIPQNTLSRRVKSNDLTADQVISICRAYTYDVIGGLKELGFISDEDLKKPFARVLLSDATDEDIVQEVLRRMKASGEHAVFDEPLQPVTSLEERRRDAKVARAQADGALENSDLQAAQEHNSNPYADTGEESQDPQDYQ